MHYKVMFGDLELGSSTIFPVTSPITLPGSPKSHDDTVLFDDDRDGDLIHICRVHEDECPGNETDEFNCRDCISHCGIPMFGWYVMDDEEVGEQQICVVCETMQNENEET